MAAAPFIFQILLPDWKDGPSDLINRSIVVEVSADMIAGASLTGEKEKTERDLAEGVARRGAAEIMQGEFGSAAVAANSIAQIGSLPDEIREQTPILQRNGLRAWLL
jgi:hypothetical protein